MYWYRYRGRDGGGGGGKIWDTPPRDFTQFFSFLKRTLNSASRDGNKQIKLYAATGSEKCIKSFHKRQNTVFFLILILQVYNAA